MPRQLASRLLLLLSATAAAAPPPVGPLSRQAGAVGVSRLAGQLHGPRGTSVTLRNNGGDDLTLMVPAGPDLYGSVGFRFNQGQPAGSRYSVTITTPPPGMTCSVYQGASGTMPAASGTLRVGCERTYDHVSRSSDDRVRALNIEAWSPQLGGSYEAIGATPPQGEGRYVAFVSSASGLSPNGRRQVFWRDRQTGETRLVSAGPSGAAGDNTSDSPAISADGRVVVFESTATDLVGSDTNGVSDIFRWSADRAGVTRVSEGPGGREADGASRSPTVSGDGAVVAFASLATNLGGKLRGGVANVYRRSIADGTNTLVSVDLDSGEGVGGDLPSISEDGNRIAYWSISSRITNGDTNGMWDIFVHQHNIGRQRRVSLRADGRERAQGGDSASRSVAPTLSGDGRHVAFASTSDDLVPDDTNGAQDVFVVDLDGPANLRRVSLSSDGEEGNGASPYGLDERVAMNHDGSRVAFTTAATNLGASSSGPNMVMRDLAAGKTVAVTDGVGSVAAPTLSRRGSHVAFGAGKALDGRFRDPGLFVLFSGPFSDPFAGRGPEAVSGDDVPPAMGVTPSSVVTASTLATTPPVAPPQQPAGLSLTTPPLAYTGTVIVSPVTTPTLAYTGVVIASPVTTPALVYTGAGIASPVTTPPLAYIGVVIPTAITTPKLVFRGSVIPTGAVRTPILVYDGATRP